MFSLNRATLFATLLAGAVSAVPAAAIAQYDPMASRAENQINSLNRSITQEQQFRGTQQQSQFETNALRSELSRSASPPLVPSVGIPPVRR